MHAIFSLDLPQDDCENAKASNSQDEKSKGPSGESTCSACGKLKLHFHIVGAKKMDVM